MLLAAKENESIDNELTKLYSRQKVGSANLQYNTNLAMKAFDYKIDQNQKAQSQAFEAAKLQAQQFFTIQQGEKSFSQQKELAGIQNKYQESRDVMNYKQDLQKLGITDAMQTRRDELNNTQQLELTRIQNQYKNSTDVRNYEQDLKKLEFQYANDPENIKKNLENQANTGTLGIMGNGKITGYGGEYDGFK